MLAKQLCVLGFSAVALAMSSAARAHATLETSTPKANEIVKVAPKQIRLQFNEPLEMAFSSVKLIDAAGAAVAPLHVALAKDSPKSMVATLPAIASGAYRVHWTALTRDGHKVKGEFAFQVK